MTDNRTNSTAAATTTGRGFPVLEIAIVLVVLGIVASIVAPRMSRGASGSSSAAVARDAVLVGRLKALRAAVAAYTNDHGGHPPDADRIVPQLTEFTDWAGRVSPVRTGQHALGPYLREVPPMPVGANRGKTTVGLPTDPGTAWTYDPTTAQVRANTRPGETDAAGRAYASY
jgi:type II secretory pathway pseudopilin PulG